MILLPVEILFLLAPLLTSVHAASSTPHFLHALGPQAVNILRLQRLAEERIPARDAIREANLVVQSNDLDALSVSLEGWKDLKLGWFEQPLDHFDASNPHKFQQRYWVNLRHYTQREGTPVIILDGGEMDSMVRESCL